MNRASCIVNRASCIAHLTSRTVHCALCIVHLTLCLLLASCSEWNTDSLGHKFTPANSIVRMFTHPVYVEYSATDISVWGPYLDEVEVSRDGMHLTLMNGSDSLALFVYGYVASQDTLGTSDASLTVSSSRPYALYMNGLALRRQDDEPVIESTGTGACHIVLSAGSVNHLYGQLSTRGALTLSGTGTLTVQSPNSCIQAATLQCQHAVNVTLTSTGADGIELTDGAMRSSLGTWRIHASRHAISSPDSILLIAGTYQGEAQQGSFLLSEKGTIVRRPTLIAASAQLSPVVDSLQASLRYDSIQSLWQQCVDTLTLQQDSLLVIRRNRLTSTAAKFTPGMSLDAPYFLISNGTILSNDTLHFSRK